MKKKDTEGDLFRFVHDPGERVLRRFGNGAAEYRRDGVRQFLVPACSGGVFLMGFGLLVPRLFSEGAGAALSSAAGFLGMLLICGGVIFYAMFERRARDAEGTELYITTKNVIYIAHGTYAILPLCDITGVRTERADRLGRVPFDISSLEVSYLILTYRGEDMKLANIADSEGAAECLRPLILSD